ncbi:MAG: GNAT family N-acyltransferase [Pseudomonadota bacterium]
MDRSKDKEAITDDQGQKDLFASVPQDPFAAAPQNPFAAAPALARLLLGLRPLSMVYNKATEGKNPCDFAQAALGALNVDVNIEGEGLESIPKTGPLLLTANHPFGGVEGIAMAAVFGRIRPDLKILVNGMLCRIQELSPFFIPVNVFGGAEKENIAGVRAAMKHLNSGGALAMFPSGVVAHWQIRTRRIAEPVWFSLCGRMARREGVVTVPLHFRGRNSMWFHAAGVIHPLLRTALLPRELWRMRNKNLNLVIGKHVESGLLRSLVDDAARTAHLRAHSEALGRVATGNEQDFPVPVAKQNDPHALLREVESFYPNATLAKEGRYTVLGIQGYEAPRMLEEIGRLREETFRQVGEGSGHARDIDKYDDAYTHLVLWDTDQNQMAGAYRIRCFAPNEAPQAKKKLYTTSLFQYKKEFFERCGYAMELGRAFVAAPYQRDYVPLMLLWKGIAQIAMREGIETLFGPCSIGLGYAPESMYMLRQHLRENRWDDDLAALASGRCEPKNFAGPNTPDVRGLDYKACNRVVKDLEGDKGLPILFKHYLQLGGKVAAFHEDHAFGTLDALLVVSMRTIPDKQLIRYLGTEGVEALRAKLA